MIKRIWLIGTLLAACAAQAQTSLPDSVAAELQAAGLAPTAISALVLPVAPGAPRLAWLEDRPMAPASTMKLVTTMVALDQLGATFRWRTQLLSEGEQKGDRLRGKLYLRGGADPNLTPDKLRGMLRSLRAQGVEHINADLVLDRSLWQPQRLDLTLPPFDETPYAYYNVIPDPLLLNSNVIEFALESDGDKVTVRTQPELAGLQVSNKITLDDTRCDDWEAPWKPANVEVHRNASMKLVLDGSYPRNCKTTTSLNLLDRNQYIARFMQAAWKELGGSWRGRVLDGSTPTTARLLVERNSDTLADAIKIINKPSDNMMARTVFLTLGAQPGAVGQDTRSAADAAVRKWFAARNIATDGLVLENGSGLSRLERISPTQMAGLLQAGARSLWYPEFSSSLPLAGVDGTMRRRLRDRVAPGQARIKTGTLRDVVAVAGYVRDRDGNDWIVSATINDTLAKKGRPALDALISWVAAGPGSAGTVAGSAAATAPSASAPKPY